jgi:CRISPR-associated endonuclease Cas1
LLEEATSVKFGGASTRIGDCAKLYGFAAPGSRFRNAAITFGVVIRTRIIAGKSANHNFLVIIALSGSRSAIKWSSKTTQTLRQHSHVRNSCTGITPRHGVVTLFGYGIRAQVERGHLILEDGIGDKRRKGRFARVGHGLKRLVLIGSDGLITLAALRWLADQKAAFVMLERDGSVLATTGPVRSSDARLRRAQALAESSGTGLQLAIRLIGEKLTGQERVARERLHNLSVAENIAESRQQLKSAVRLQSVLTIEANAASTYWSAWSKLPILYPRTDLARVPDHWQTFGARVSPLTGSPRLAVNPVNSVLSYLYAILQAEARLAAAELGLDPGLGVLHKDTPNRDSLACDLMEPVRPLVDSYVFDWMNRGPLRREWFFELANGNCRLMGSFAAQLSETATVWRKAVSPHAEQAAKIFWQGRAKRSKFSFLPTRLTQARRTRAKAGNRVANVPAVPDVKPRCPVCGSAVTTGSVYCATCVPAVNRENLLEQAKLGRIATHSATAEARRSATQTKQVEALRKWNPADLPTWLDEDVYRQEILPLLSKFTVKSIRLKLGVSHPYATLIRRGMSIPHPRHWLPLAELAGFQL